MLRLPCWNLSTISGVRTSIMMRLLDAQNCLPYGTKNQILTVLTEVDDTLSGNHTKIMLHFTMDICRQRNVEWDVKPYILIHNGQKNNGHLDIRLSFKVIPDSFNPVRLLLTLSLTCRSDFSAEAICSVYSRIFPSFIK